MTVLPRGRRCANLRAGVFHGCHQHIDRVMNELHHSLERMGFMQLLLLFGFVTTYMVAVGGLFGAQLRWRAAGAALAQAAAFAVLTEPWVHGALLVVFVVAGLGLFVMLSWLLAQLSGAGSLVVPPAPTSVMDTVAPGLPPPAQAGAADSAADSPADSPAAAAPAMPSAVPLGAVAKLARRVRVTR